MELPYANNPLKRDAPDLIQSPEQLFRSVGTSLLAGRPDAASSALARRALSTGTDAVRAVSRIEKMEQTLMQLERGDIEVRSRSVETEHLLRRQYSLSEASNLLLSSGTVALSATQLHAAGSFEPAAGMAVFSALLGLVYLRKQVQLSKKEKFT